MRIERRKLLAAFSALIAAAAMFSGCRPGTPLAQSSAVASTTAESTLPETTAPTAETLPDYTFWNDIVEIINRAGDTTTVYKLVDGTYMDGIRRTFTFDGKENWICSDGSEWNRTLEDCERENATQVNAEFVIERLLAQRPDHKFFSDAPDSPYASKILLTFSTDITHFRFLEVDGEFDRDGSFHCRNFREIYSEYEVTADDLMVVETELPEIIPTRAISFVDVTGNTRYYYLLPSGEDNVPLLIRFGNF